MGIGRNLRAAERVEERAQYNRSVVDYQEAVGEIQQRAAMLGENYTNADFDEDERSLQVLKKDILGRNEGLSSDIYQSLETEMDGRNVAVSSALSGYAVNSAVRRTRTSELTTLDKRATAVFLSPNEGMLESTIKGIDEHLASLQSPVQIGDDPEDQVTLFKSQEVEQYRGVLYAKSYDNLINGLLSKGEYKEAERILKKRGEEIANRIGPAKLLQARKNVQTFRKSAEKELEQKKVEHSKLYLGGLLNKAKNAAERGEGALALFLSSEEGQIISEEMTVANNADLMKRASKTEGLRDRLTFAQQTGNPIHLSGQERVKLNKAFEESFVDLLTTAAKEEGALAAESGETPPGSEWYRVMRRVMENLEGGVNGFLPTEPMEQLGNTIIDGLKRGQITGVEKRELIQRFHHLGIKDPDSISNARHRQVMVLMNNGYDFERANQVIDGQATVDPNQVKLQMARLGEQPIERIAQHQIDAQSSWFRPSTWFGADEPPTRDMLDSMQIRAEEYIRNAGMDAVSAATLATSDFVIDKKTDYRLNTMGGNEWVNNNSQFYQDLGEHAQKGLMVQHLVQAGELSPKDFTGWWDYFWRNNLMNEYKEVAFRDEKGPYYRVRRETGTEGVSDFVIDESTNRPLKYRINEAYNGMQTFDEVLSRSPNDLSTGVPWDDIQMGSRSDFDRVSLARGFFEPDEPEADESGTKVSPTQHPFVQNEDGGIQN